MIDYFLDKYNSINSRNLMAFDAKTGKELWRVDHPEMDTWATPLVVEHNGRAQVIVNAMNRVRSFDLETGRPVEAPNLRYATGDLARVEDSRCGCGVRGRVLASFEGRVSARFIAADGRQVGPDVVVRKGRGKPHRKDRRWVQAWSPEEIE